MRSFLLILFALFSCETPKPQKEDVVLDSEEVKSETSNPETPKVFFEKQNSDGTNVNETKGTEKEEDSKTKEKTSPENTNPKKWNNPIQKIEHSNDAVLMPEGQVSRPISNQDSPAVKTKTDPQDECRNALKQLENQGLKMKGDGFDPEFLKSSGMKPKKETIRKLLLSALENHCSEAQKQILRTMIESIDE